MERSIYQSLLGWKNKQERKPLILNGARQVGKTYILQEFGRREYRQLAFFSLDRDQKAAEVFEKGGSAADMLMALSAISQVDITPNDTLVVLDEIQDCPKALEALKYFLRGHVRYSYHRGRILAGHFSPQRRLLSCGQGGGAAALSDELPRVSRRDGQKTTGKHLDGRQLECRQHAGNRIDQSAAPVLLCGRNACRRPRPCAAKGTAGGAVHPNADTP